MKSNLSRSVISVAALACMCGQAIGQNALGDGTMLDRNLQVGSGGRNTQVRDIGALARFNNAVVTGNVANRSFHGSVGYAASDEFRGVLGSNSLYTFRRDTLPGSYSGFGVRASDALRYQFALATGQAVPSALSGGVGLVVPRAGAVPPPRSTVSSALRSTSDFLTAQSLRPTLIGYRSSDDGQVMTATASPLVGITWHAVDTSTTQRAARPIVPGTPDTGATRARPDNGLTGLEPTVAGMPSPLELTGMGRTGDTSEAIDTKVISRSEGYTRVLDSFRTNFEQTTGRTADESRPAAIALEDSEAPWRKELDQLRESMRVGLDPVRKDERVPARGDRVPTDPKVDQGAPMTTPGTDAEPTRAAAERAERAKKTYLSPQMVEILKNSGVRIDTLRPASSPAEQAAYVSHIEAGQEMLRTGKFFDAEERFTRAISALPGDPLAAIGRVHAQLGAGLYLSAASNLRELLRKHPEMAAARFNTALVPSDERATAIAAQLRVEIERGSASMVRDASLLLAYLGRIREDTAMRDEGLNMWKENLGDEEAEAVLHELLSKVWGSAAP